MTNPAPAEKANTSDATNDKPVQRPACSALLREDRPRFVLRDPNHPLHIFRCGCGLHYSDYAVRRTSPEVYDSSYYEHPRYTDDAGRDDYICHLAEFLDPATSNVTGRRLLDIGCATGDFVAWAREAGWQAEGVDLSEQAVQMGQANGLPLRQAAIEDLAQCPQRYDVVTLWDVLEHLPDPLAALRTVRGVLADGGVLVLKTVTCISLVDRLARLMYRATLGHVQGPLKRMYVPGHLYYFTPETLRRTLRNAGWEVEALAQTDTPPSALSASALTQTAFAALWALQRWTNRSYELLAACKAGP